MTYLTFIAFYNFIVLIGRGAVCFLTSIGYIKIKNKIFNLDFQYIYPLIGLFVIGNLTLLINFFIPITTLLTFVMLSVLILFNLLKINFKYERRYLISNLLIPLVLSFSTNTVSLHYDAGLYHLQFQNWLRSYKVVENLILANNRFGYSSIYDYISSNFWWNENFILLHFINLVFIGSFLSILIYYLFSQEDLFLKLLSLSIFLYAFLDNFGYKGGRNGFIYIESIGKQDTAFAIIFFLACIFIIYSIKLNTYTLDGLLIISTLTLFAFQLRLFGIFIIVLFILYLFKISQKFRLKDVIIQICPQILLGLLWLIKNIIISGCIIFPVSITCFEQLVPNIDKIVHQQSASLAQYYRAYKLGDNVFIWGIEFANHSLNLQLMLNFLISFVLIKLFFKIVFIKTKEKNFVLYLSVLITIVINFLTLIFTGPGNRFFVQIFLLVISTTYLVSVKTVTFRFIALKKYSKNFAIIISILSIILIPRLSDYLNFKNGLKIINIEIEKVDYFYLDDYWGTNPINSSLCWKRIDCVYGNPKISFNYKNLSFKKSK